MGCRGGRRSARSSTQKPSRPAPAPDGRRFQPASDPVRADAAPADNQHAPRRAQIVGRRPSATAHSFRARAEPPPTGSRWRNSPRTASPPPGNSCPPREPPKPPACANPPTMAPSRAASDSAHFKNQISKPLKIPDDSTRPEIALAPISSEAQTKNETEASLNRNGTVVFYRPNPNDSAKATSNLA